MRWYWWTLIGVGYVGLAMLAGRLMKRTSRWYPPVDDDLDSRK